MKTMEEKLTTTEQVIQLKTEDIENLKAKLEAAEKADHLKTTQIEALQNKVKHLKIIYLIIIIQVCFELI